MSRPKRAPMAVAGGLLPPWYDAIVHRGKRREYRYRQRPDVLLEELRRGDTLVLFCKRRAEAVVCRVTQVGRIDITAAQHPTRRRGYCIFFTLVRQVYWPRHGRRQGIVRLDAGTLERLRLDAGKP